jgi:hypothetical protein
MTSVLLRDIKSKYYLKYFTFSLQKYVPINYFELSHIILIYLFIIQLPFTFVECLFIFQVNCVQKRKSTDQTFYFQYYLFTYRNDVN